ncbi:MAG TPA: hypothetical protein VGM03_20850, partial [Phycisphaerae bacterium]
MFHRPVDTRESSLLKTGTDARSATVTCIVASAPRSEAHRWFIAVAALAVGLWAHSGARATNPTFVWAR